MRKCGLACCCHHTCCTYSLCYKELPTGSKFSGQVCCQELVLCCTLHSTAQLTGSRPFCLTYSCFLGKASPSPWIQQQLMQHLRRAQPVTVASSSNTRDASLLQLKTAPQNSVEDEDSTCMIVLIKGHSLACPRHHAHT